MTIAGVILAGGLSRRMGGGDKGLLDLGGASMLTHVIKRIAPQVDLLVLNANGDPARFADFALPVVSDPLDDFPGPLAGVLAGLTWAREKAPGTTHVASVSSDAPFLPEDLVCRLARALAQPGAPPIAMARSQGHVHPVIGLWPVALADDLHAGLTSGVRKVLHWTDRHGVAVVDFEPTVHRGEAVDPFFNANTPEDLAKAKAILSGSVTTGSAGPT